MHSLVVLSDQPKWNSYYSIVFPLYKWHGLFKNHGINLKITTDRYDKALENADTVIVVSRHFADWQNIQKRTPEIEASLIAYLEKLKTNVKKVIWFDRSDGSGSTDFSIIPYVDIFLKNQILKDKSYYTQNNGAFSVRKWLIEDDNLQDHLKKYFPCPADQLDKIRLGWNIAHSDHRTFVGKDRVISNYIFYTPKFSKPRADKKLDFSFRGSLNYGTTNAAISSQRNQMIPILKELTKYKTLISGERLDKKTFMKELADSKICISPFGWGEVCYRDFEAFVTGSLLVKPSMDHLITYPNVFIENSTYIPTKWDFSDFKEQVENVIDNYPQYLHVAKNAQDTFLNVIKDGEGFAQWVKKCIE